ncbi:MAG: peptidase domain-containing ABC transporter [Lysobacterales bacterium]
MQAESAECGLACVAMVAGFHGFGVTLDQLRQRHRGSLKGATLRQLADVAQSLELATRPVRLELDELDGLRLPCILHWDFNHFVVLEKVTASALWITDPARGRRRVVLADASQKFTGVALELSPTGAFRKAQAEPTLKLRHFFQAVTHISGPLFQILGLSLILQVLALAGPYYSQLVIDEVIVTADTQLLIVLALGFACLGLWQLLMSTARSWLVLYLGTRLRLAWVVRLFRHLLELPLDYFQRRHVGDIVSRFGSISAVQALVTTATVEAVVDGVMALTTLAVMWVYSGPLTLVVVILLTLQLAVQLAFYPASRRAQQATLVSQAAEASHFMETLRAMPTIKSFAAEGARESRWLNQLTNSINDQLRVSRLGIFQSAVLQVLTLGDRILVLYLAALAVLDSQLTLGMLMAYLAFKAHFAGAAQALIAKWIQFRMVSVHLERLADIVSSEPEPSGQQEVPVLQGRITTQDLCFRYDAQDPALLNHLNLDIAPGECVAVAGPSGCGKSTLLKLLLGLLEPNEGQVLVDGVPLSQLKRGDYRRQVAAVLQDDQLLSGSLRDNIGLFSSQIDEDRMRSVAEQAAIANTINQLPMGYETLVGDMGSSLSGGQRQRILLARALYQRPAILLLDEASSHLDVTTERVINHGLAALPMTRILVAHRRETLAMADRVITLR